MTISQIKKEALRLMGVVGREIEDVPIATLEGESAYAPYLRRMTGAINRALADLERRMALTPVRLDVAYGEWRHAGVSSRLTLGEDVYGVLCVLAEDEAGQISDLPFVAAGKELIVARLDTGASAAVLYSPRVRAVEAGEESVVPAHVPETLLSLIPYFIKEELYFEEEPNEALRAGTVWSSGVESYLATRDLGGSIGVRRVGTVYAWEEV